MNTCVMYCGVLAAAFLIAGFVTADVAPPAPPLPAPPLRVLMLGGGPDLPHNQAAIESNVRYVSRLLPKNAENRILFFDGKAQSKDVLCEDSSGRQYYRRPLLPRLDGPDTLPAIKAQFKTLAAGPPNSPVLIYATGHGSPGDETLDNNDYDLWNGGYLSVHTLVGEIKTLPEPTPITLVMAQCFSGSFGNLLFQNGDPKAPLINRHLCGFFASISARPAAGCTPEVNEADYHDFTGYFFAALSGRSRLGKPVTGADYNHDGKIGMDEAFAYTLIHDDSIDTPVCTSDVFLRRFVPDEGFSFVGTPWSELTDWATPAQRAALNALSADLHEQREGRLQDTYALFQKTKVDAEDLPSVHVLRLMRLAKSVVLAHRLMTSDAPADQPLKVRYQLLKAAEARNCLTDAPQQ